MSTELTADEQRQAIEDLNLGMQLAIDERDLDARAKLQKRASEIAEKIAQERAVRQVNAIEAGAASAVASAEARADEAHAEAEGAPLTPGDDVAKAVAAGQAAEAEVEVVDKAASKAGDSDEAPGTEPGDTVEEYRNAGESKASAEAERTVDVEGPDQGPDGTRADVGKTPSAAKDSKALAKGKSAASASDSKAK